MEESTLRSKAQLNRLVVLAPEVRVPYPEPSTEAASVIGRANRSRDTIAERALRSDLHRRGLRFRTRLRLTPAGLPRGVRPDLTFVGARVAVFVDGCFWHGCEVHRHIPRSNARYWRLKFAANRRRDRRVDAALRRAGWLPLRLWEHEDATKAAGEVERFVRHRQRGAR